MDLGFYHPDKGFWVASGGQPVEALLATYPTGTINIALPPTDGNYAWVNNSWQKQPDPPPPPLTQDDYKLAIQTLVDQTAEAKQYTDGNSCATYALLTASPAGTMWKEEGEAFVAWRANVWAYAFAQLAAVQAGTRTQPTVAELIAEINSAYPIAWPVAS